MKKIIRPLLPLAGLAIIALTGCASDQPTQVVERKVEYIFPEKRVSLVSAKVDSVAKVQEVRTVAAPVVAAPVGVTQVREVVGNVGEVTKVKEVVY